MPSDKDVQPNVGSTSGAGLGSLNFAEQRRSPGSALNAIAEIADLLPGAAQLRTASRAWWPSSHADALDAASTLLDCAAPIDLEEAVCDLLGGQWRRLYATQKTGLEHEAWLEALLDVAKERAGEPAVRRLLHGVAVIAAPGLATQALGLLHAAPDSEESAWVARPPAVTTSPDALLLRDSYGLRFGLLTQVTGSSERPRTYMFDVDLCHGFSQVLASGYHPDVTTAASAWRDLVGASADEVEPAPAPGDLLPHLLSGGGMIDELFGAPLSDSHFKELYRADRITSAFADARKRARQPISWTTTKAQQRSTALAATLTTRFKAWAAAQGLALSATDGSDDDIVSYLIQDWVTPGMTEELSLSCSPHRIAAFTAYLSDDWLPEQRVQALGMLETWAQYCLELSSITGQAAEHTLAWARRAAQEPELVGRDLGNHLNRPIDETTLAAPTLPDYVR